MDIEKRIIILIARNFKKDILEISKETKLIDELGADSLDLIELMLDIEDEFGIDFDDKSGENIWSVKDAIDEIEKIMNRSKVDKRKYII
jgi:acyl carrier protein